MQDKAGKILHKFILAHVRRRRLLSVVLVLAALVGMGVFWQLRMIGVSMTGEAYCGYTEHEHTPECMEQKLICTFAQSEAQEALSQKNQEETSLVCEKAEHTHEEACFETKYTLNCEMSLEHQHDEGCFDDEAQLICTLEETPHIHTDECYVECVELICPMEEHQHQEACYKTEEVPLFMQEEGTAQESTIHMHTDECYETVYICGFEEDGHVHSLACYSNPNADLETADAWERSIQDVELTGVWSEDLLAIAQTQLGYRESRENYFVYEGSEETKGITRYGQWYGDAYGDWCAMYVSWCLNYAKIPKEYVPYESGCTRWVKQLTEKNLFVSSLDANPQRGDIIFFDSNQDGLSEHVGIVSDVEADLEKVQIHTIEGNSANAVNQREYPLTSPAILGYADLHAAYERFLSAQVVEEGVEAAIFTDASYTQTISDGMKIRVSGNLPNDAVIYAYPVQVALEERSVLCAYDITVFLSDGSVYEPEEELTVHFITQTLPSQEAETQYSIYYIPDNGDPQEVETIVTQEGVRFAAAHFSVYALALGQANQVDSAQALKSSLENAGGEVSLQLVSDLTLNQAIVLSAGANVTLDLNGHSLTAQNSDIPALFTIPQNAFLTLVDTAFVEDPTVSDPVSVSASQAGREAQVTENEDGSFTLAYYITESVQTDAANGKTTETRYLREMTSRGLIRSEANYPLFSVTGGTLQLNGGFIYGENASRQAIAQSGGRVTLSGGCICGFTQSNTHNETYYGGAVRTSGGTLEITGSFVLAGNRAPTGGAVAALGGTLEITGGVVSGNTATLDCSTNEGNKDYGGGGIYAKNALVTMSAGYITNNIAACRGYFNGGGAILLFSSTMDMTGGYITSNQAASGGGIRTAFANNNRVLITGGFICANYARSAEGGGVCIDNQGYCEVDAKESGSAIYVNNNATDSSEHWGGGGLFVANGGTMFVRNVLITQNAAGGYGGGVAGCSTGRVVVAIQNGAAIFNNTAQGIHLSGSSSTKSDDNTYAALSRVFLENGYADYYCALASTVYGGMLGDYAANWMGSIDGAAVANVGVQQVLNSSYIMGLTAHPSATAIAAAQEKACVYVTGNFAYTHGGGILSNGHLVVGNVFEFEIGDSLQLEADKMLLDDSGVRLPIGEGDFTFEIIDEMNNVVSIGTTQQGGAVYFDRRLSFEKDGVYSFIIRETDSVDPSIVKDTAQYLLTVTVQKDTLSLSMGNNESVTYYFYRIAHLKLEKQTDTALEVLFDGNVSSSESSAYKYILPSPSFTNYRMQHIDITVKKVWQGTVLPQVQVMLLRNGEVCDTQTLQPPHWRYTWENLPTSENDINYSYTVRETVPDGYVASYTNSNEANADAYWVPATELIAGEQYMILNAEKNQALFISQGHENNPFTTSDKLAVTPGTGSLHIGENTYSEWIPNEGISARAVFTAQSDRNGIIFKCNGTTNNTWLLVEDNGGNFLKSTSGANYASLFTFNNRLQGRVGWSAAGTLRNVMYESGKFNTSLSTTGAVRLFTRVSGPITQSTTITITNTPVEEKRFVLNLTKQDADNEDIKLPNAVFELRGEDGPLAFVGEDGRYAAVEQNEEPFPENAVTQMVTVAKGRLVLTNLPAGTYVLHEVAAPDGYHIANDETIVLGSGEEVNLSITIEDQRIEDLILPQAGGSGILPHLLGGLLLLAAAFGFFLTKKARKGMNAP